MVQFFNAEKSFFYTFKKLSSTICLQMKMIHCYLMIGCLTLILMLAYQPNKLSSYLVPKNYNDITLLA